MLSALASRAGLAFGGLLLTLASPTPAAARVFFSFGLPLYPPPVYYYPPPTYYPPPVYYAPPVQYAPPPQYAPPAAPLTGPSAQSCYAGAYTCPMDRPTAAGAACYCMGNGGSRIWGRAS